MKKNRFRKRNEVTKQVVSAFRQLGVVLYEDLSAESYFFFFSKNKNNYLTSFLFRRFCNFH